MVSLDILNQGHLFLAGLICGLCMLFVYDLLRIFRRVVSHGTVWIAVEDILYWCGCALMIFRMLYRQNDGLIRGFAMIAIFVGMLLYNWLLSRFIIKAGVKIFGGIVKALVFIVKTITAPIRFVLKKNGRFLKKRLKKIWKTIRMGLCKL
ncbi:spore cortex biosynthesis protein YabQ [uncultured Roseburia sp.]|uniref:Spore cortex biosynthesis protein YabQ n=1 Tax=Brotonthovivens ammoniilytica TaxID=2981725 RepID=A0ABT2TL37_9FIRM|nr:spore cortex biosynthesis protein YabQ [Brotonthovivens ammoniilytica]MCU6762920.1 spore cortex biosynthesis protein YabQ [Brotonthovivens ammoniilytica]SCI93870.1 spore cortex biosynthesis protein YabQ [uncultured Roseburia sp.]